MTSATTQLKVPSTQNMAQVLEFRCLFTHDLRQKKKRWQDGFLRFHTFNKRVMVYDVPRNFIGDTHWLEEEVVQDGAELRLDKGVLVEVGEAMGTTEQDLTELLKKARHTQDSQAVVDANSRSKYSATARPTTTPLGQLRPTSLNALLGTPKGAYGRAVVPAKSLIENRGTGVDRLHEKERLAKRQRLNSGVETVTTTAAASPAPCKILPSDIQINTSRPTASRKGKLSKSIEYEVISIESDDDGMVRSSPVKPAESSLRAPSEAMPRLSTTPHASRKPTGNGRKPSVPPLGNMLNITGPSSVYDPQAAGNEKVSSTEVRRPVNRLRSAAIKSRRKLIYRELLPPQAASKSLHIETRIHTTTEVEESTGPNIDFLTTEPHTNFIPSLGIYPNIVCASSQQATMDAGTGINEITLASKPLASEKDAQHIRTRDERQAIFVSQDSSHETDADVEFTRVNQISCVPRRPIATPKFIDLIANQPLQDTAKDSMLGNKSIPNRQEEPRNSQQIQVPVPQLAQVSMTVGVLDKSCQPVRLRAASIAPDHLSPPQLPHRSPLKKTLSESNRCERPTRTLLTKRSLQRASSELSGICRTSVGIEKAVKEASPRQDKNLGPWGREAFDLFGWRQGDSKELPKLTP